MESDIKYVLIVTYGGKPHIADHSNQLEQMHRWLVQEKQDCPAFHILNAQRYVISAAGTVNVTEIRIDFNEDALYIFDKYGTLVDRYISATPQEPEEQEFYVRRSETWVNVKKVWAKSAEEAIAKVEQDVAAGTFDVMEGWLEDCTTGIGE